MEGSGNNKCIEIYNGTGGPIDLGAGNYTIARYSNGGTTPTSITLTGTIADGDVFVVCNSSSTLDSAMAAQADQFLELFLIMAMMLMRFYIMVLL